MAEKMTERDKYYYNKGYDKAVEDTTNLAKEPNKMKMVAALFGKKLDEEFEIRYKDENYLAYFRKEGLKVRGLFCLTWDTALVALLTNKAVIVDE